MLLKMLAWLLLMCYKYFYSKAGISEVTILSKYPLTPQNTTTHYSAADNGTYYIIYNLRIVFILIIQLIKHLCSINLK